MLPQGSPWRRAWGRRLVCALLPADNAHSMKPTAAAAKSGRTVTRSKPAPRAGAHGAAPLVTVVDGFEVYRSALRPKHLTQEQINQVLRAPD